MDVTGQKRGFVFLEEWKKSFFAFPSNLTDLSPPHAACFFALDSTCFHGVSGFLTATDFILAVFKIVVFLWFRGKKIGNFNRANTCQDRANIEQDIDHWAKLGQRRPT